MGGLQTQIPRENSVTLALALTLILALTLNLHCGWTRNSSSSQTFLRWQMTFNFQLKSKRRPHWEADSITTDIKPSIFPLLCLYCLNLPPSDMNSAQDLCFCRQASSSVSRLSSCLLLLQCHRLLFNLFGALRSCSVFLSACVPANGKTLHRISTTAGSSPGKKSYTFLNVDVKHLVSTWLCGW